jgi:hypothetical protein
MAGKADVIAKKKFLKTAGQLCSSSFRLKQPGPVS